MSENNKRLVAIIDSNAKHRAELEAALMSFYDVVSFDDGKDGIKALVKNQPALIIVGEDILPGGCIRFISALREERELYKIPILLIINPKSHYQRIAEGKAAGMSGYIEKPYRRSAIIKAITHHLNAEIEHDWEALPETQKAALEKSMAIFQDIADVMMTGETVQFNNIKDNCQPLVTAIESNDFNSILDNVRMHDDYTYAHSMRVATMLTLLGHAAGFKNDEQLMLASGGLLHDVGKMMIPHHILNKPGKLTDEEFEIMKSHVPRTIEYLKESGGIPKSIFIIADQHHEKLNGMGYPKGLKGAELNELARMAAVVDVFSALTDRRVYKPAMEASKAMMIMEEEMPGHFDPAFVKMFKDILIDAQILK